MNSGAMLNAYPDSMGGCLAEIADMLETPDFADAFRSFYILPSVFNTDLDRGFSVIRYDLNRMTARQRDIERLRALKIDLTLDLVLNHLSVLSPQFQDILRHGDQSAYRDFFIDWNRFWQGHGEMTEAGYIQPDAELIRDMFFRKPGLPILMARMPDGRDAPYWNTFYQEVRYDPVDAQDLMAAAEMQYGEADALAKRINAALADGKAPGEMDFEGFETFAEAVRAWMESRRRYLGQLDLNLKSEKVWQYYDEVLTRLKGYGAAMVRLDAFAYAAKAPGKRNFMNGPETWEALERVRGLADKHGLTLLPEIHASYCEGSYRQLASKGYWTYDFFLPGLVIDAIENHEAMPLARWARELKERNIHAVNMLGCHDGIPMLDLKGLLPEERIQQLIDLIVSRGGLIKNLHGQKNLYYQVNATYFSALGHDERKLLLARAIQLFMPGKPQVWYLDLFAGGNDLEAVRRAGAAGHKEINRTNLSREQMLTAMKRPVVRDQLTLLRMRNACPAFAFDAAMTFEATAPDEMTVTWRKDGARASLTANLSTLAFCAEADTAGGKQTYRQA